MARKAAKSFDGSDYGSDYLNFLEGAPILRVDHPEETELWAFGVLLDQAAEGERPVSGWFPESYWGDLAECSNGPLQACSDFDAQEYGSAYLSFRHGDVLVPMRHSEADDAWSFGALLLDTESSMALPRHILPQGRLVAGSGSVEDFSDWPDSPVIQERGRFQDRPPRGAGIIAICEMRSKPYVCLCEQKK